MKPLVAAVAVLVVLVLCVPVQAQTPEIDALRVRAEAGDADAQYDLGVMYANGEGVPQDDAEALRLYRLAAGQGNANAQDNLGNMYDYGRGVPEDAAEAVRWFRLAADQGHAGAQFQLGGLYDAGEGIRQDGGEAIRWYLRADERSGASRRRGGSNVVYRLANPPDPEESDEDPLELAFNEELIARYTTESVGVQTLRGRPTYVLAFKPRPGKLPARRRLDRALNKSRGEIWIDQDTFEVARLTFELTERVRLWWGILGSVSNVTGRIERRLIAEDVWMPDEIDVYYEYRVLFSNSRRGGTTRWTDFTSIGE
jgi:hypothetical protein